MTAASCRVFPRTRTAPISTMAPSAGESIFRLIGAGVAVGVGLGDGDSSVGVTGGVVDGDGVPVSVAGEPPPQPITAMLISPIRIADHTALALVITARVLKIAPP
ncbi:MAG: hypothetical protein ACOC6S_02110, partial [Chloroflexota bacterium]